MDGVCMASMSTIGLSWKQLSSYHQSDCLIATGCLRRGRVYAREFLALDVHDALVVLMRNKYESQRRCIIMVVFVYMCISRTKHTVTANPSGARLTVQPSSNPRPTLVQPSSNPLQHTSLRLTSTQFSPLQPISSHFNPLQPTSVLGFRDLGFRDLGFRDVGFGDVGVRD